MSFVPRLREWLVDVERTWLGWSFAPPVRVLARSAWSPDGTEAYCARCGGTVGPGEATRTGCAVCRSMTIATDRVVRLGRYAGPLREWVRAIKYRAWAEMADTLGRHLGDAVAASIDGLERRRVIVVPMPMPWQRRLYRGIDHARMLADAVAARLDVPQVSLLSMRNGPPQVSLSAGRRPRRGARMVLRRSATRLKGGLDGMRIVLVDDVRTTGASLAGAARLLRRLGARQVLAAVVAVTDDPARTKR